MDTGIPPEFIAIGAGMLVAWALGLVTYFVVDKVVDDKVDVETGEPLSLYNYVCLQLFNLLVFVVGFGAMMLYTVWSG